MSAFELTIKYICFLTLHINHVDNITRVIEVSAYRREDTLDRIDTHPLKRKGDAKAEQGDMGWKSPSDKGQRIEQKVGM